MTTQWWVALINGDIAHITNTMHASPFITKTFHTTNECATLTSPCSAVHTAGARDNCKTMSGLLLACGTQTDLGADAVQDAGHAADDNGGPGVDSGAGRCDGDQASEGAVAERHQVVMPGACRRAEDHTVRDRGHDQSLRRNRPASLMRLRPLPAPDLLDDQRLDNDAFNASTGQQQRKAGLLPHVHAAEALPDRKALVGYVGVACDVNGQRVTAMSTMLKSRGCGHTPVRNLTIMALTNSAVRPAAQGAKVVATAATATGFEVPAPRMAVSEPGLNPYQPNHRIITPRIKSE